MVTGGVAALSDVPCGGGTGCIYDGGVPSGPGPGGPSGPCGPGGLGITGLIEVVEGVCAHAILIDPAPGSSVEISWHLGLDTNTVKNMAKDIRNVAEIIALITTVFTFAFSTVYSATSAAVAIFHRFVPFLSSPLEVPHVNTL